jgi:hypothetical protein
VSGPVSLVLELRIVHDRWGSSSDPSINDHLHYPNDLDGSLKEAVTDKIRNITLIIITIPQTLSPLCLLLSVRRGVYIVCELVLLLFLQSHRETDNFIATSGVQLP